MDNQNLQNLQKIAKIFQPENIITSTEIDQVLKGIMEILATYKKGTESINQETKQVVEEMLGNVVKIHKESLSTIKEDTQELKDKTEKLFNSKIEEAKRLIQELKAMELESQKESKDDTDDEEEKQALIEEIMAQIELPEYKATIVSGEEIVDKINELPLSEDNKIDYARLKNVPVIKGKVISGSPTVISNAVDLDGSTRADGYTIIWDATRGRYTHSASGGSMSIGGSITSATAGSILFAGTSGVLAQDNTNFFWDDTSKQLGIGTASPGQQLNIYRSNTAIGSQLTVEQASTGDATIQLLLTGTRAWTLGIDNSDSDKFKITNNSAGVGTNDLFTMDTSGLFGFGTTAPTHTLTLPSTSTGVALYNTADQTTNYERLRMYFSSNIFNILTEAGGTGVGRALNLAGGGGNQITLGQGVGITYTRALSTSASPVHKFTATAMAGSSGVQVMQEISGSVAQSSTAGYTMLLVNPTITTTGSGTQSLFSAQLGGAERFGILSTGATTITSTATYQFTLAYDGSNNATFAVSSAGDLTINASGADVQIAAASTLRMLGGFATSSTNANANLYVSTAASGSGTTQTEVLIGGASALDFRIYERGSTSLTLTANRAYAGHIIGSMAVTEASSGTHPIISALAIKPVAITNGTATTTNGATLYIQGAATGTTPTNNYSLWVDADTARFDGAVIYNDNAITATANAATIPVTARQHDVTNNSAATLTITLTTTGAVDGQMQLIRVFDFSAAAQTLTWVNTENSDVSVPATSNGSTTLPRTVLFQYNTLTSKWRCIANV